MEDIGDLVFYIMAAIFILIGIFNNRKKKSTAPRSQPVDTEDYGDDLTVKEVAEKARSRAMDTISSEGSSWNEEDGAHDKDSGRAWLPDVKPRPEGMVVKPTDKDYSSETRKAGVKEPSYSDGEWVEPMAAMFSKEGVSAFLQKEEHIYDLDIEEISDPDAIKKMEVREQSRANAIGSRFNLEEAIIFSEILKRRDNF